MIKYIGIVIGLLSTISSYTQNPMRTVEELINTKEPGWPVVQGWIKEATNKVEILSGDSVKGREALYKTQVTTRSPMGAIIYSTGGILIDHGWIRILGSGNSRLNRSLPDWNKGISINEFGEQPPFLLIADDVVGGYFAINGGAFGEDFGKVYYLAPDNLKWESLGMTYTEFLFFCFNGKLDKFYKSLRWKNWEKEVAALDGNEVFNFYPFLWTKEGKNIDKCSRKNVPIHEQYQLNINMRKQLRME
jgi:hypothetical protein